MLKAGGWPSCTSTRRPRASAGCRRSPISRRTPSGRMAATSRTAVGVRRRRNAKASSSASVASSTDANSNAVRGHRPNATARPSAASSRTPAISAGAGLIGGCLDLQQQRIQDLVDAAAFDLHFRRQRDAMPQRRARDLHDIVRRDEIAAVQHRLRTRGAHQGNAAARAGTQRDARPFAGGAHDAHRVVEHRPGRSRPAAVPQLHRQHVVRLATR
jgi:hypothetical protein